MKITLMSAVAMILVLAATGCQNTGKSGGSLKEAATTRTLERERLHDAAELAKAYDAGKDDPDEVILLFVNALLLIQEDKDAGFAAAAYMSRPNDQWEDEDGPTGVKPSQMASETLKRMAARPELARSYAGGDGDDYTMSDPETVKLTVVRVDERADGDEKYFLESTGKENEAPVRLKREDGRWYIEDWGSLSTGVK